MNGTRDDDHSKRANKIALSLILFVALMIGVAYAAVPLYEAFCRVTGFGGTTQRVDSVSDVILDRKVRIRFDANVDNKLAWDFEPVQSEITLKLGENANVFYKATNLSNKATMGISVFNVTPSAAGIYFNKIECFCFTEQELKVGESTEMGIDFYIDPAYADDPELEHINTITLSYTFYPVEG